MVLGELKENISIELSTLDEPNLSNAEGGCAGAARQTEELVFHRRRKRRICLHRDDEILFGQYQFNSLLLLRVVGVGYGF